MYIAAVLPRFQLVFPPPLRVQRTNARRAKNAHVCFAESEKVNAKADGSPTQNSETKKVYLEQTIIAGSSGKGWSVN